MKSVETNPVDQLEIAPGVTVSDWKKLDLRNKPELEENWLNAADIVEKRLMKRYFEPCQILIKEEKTRANKRTTETRQKGKGDSPYYGFTIMAINCLLVETLQSFILGKTSTKDQSEALSVQFLKTADSFKSHFNHDSATQFYQDIRCGLLHIGETQRLSLIRSEGSLLSAHNDGIVINRNLFFDALLTEFRSYLALLREKKPSQGRTAIRRKMKTKMDFICRIKSSDKDE